MEPKNFNNADLNKKNYQRLAYDTSKSKMGKAKVIPVIMLFTTLIIIVLALIIGITISKSEGEITASNFFPKLIMGMTGQQDEISESQADEGIALTSTCAHRNLEYYPIMVGYSHLKVCQDCGQFLDEERCAIRRNSD